MRFVEELLNRLNPKLWDENNKLYPDVELYLKNIRDTFIEGLNNSDIPAEIVDTRIVGSNASYNYTVYSDLDLHIIVNLDDKENKDLLQMIYNFYKSSFNQKHNISIKGINVELYIEDKNDNLISNGVYSLDTGKWLKFPEEIESPDNIDIEEPLNYMIDRYNEICLLNNRDMAQSFLDTLYINRTRSLAVEGEFGVDNLIFKEFRNRGFIQNLKDIIVTGEDYELTLECLKEKFL